MKVYEMNDRECWLANSPKEATQSRMEYYNGYDDSDEDLDPPRELTEDELNSRVYVFDIRDPDSGRCYFAQELQRRIAAGVNKPEMFSSTEY